MSQAKLLRGLIGSLTDSEFDIIASIYLKDVDDMKNVIKCNGPYDSGLDFRASDFSEIQIQFQVTTIENSFVKKLNEDLEKAKNNTINFHLPNRVKYFYSYPLSNKSILEYKREAKTKFNIVLDIIDANCLAEVATYYDSIRQKILDFSEFDKFSKETEFFDNDKVRSFYDLMSTGSATDIKYNIIKSFVIHFLFTNGISNKFKVIENTNFQFKSNLSDDYMESIFRRMNAENIIKKNGDFEIFLTDHENKRVSNVLEEYRIEEAIVLKSISEIIDLYNIEIDSELIIVKLSELYESNYAINLSEFTHRNSTIFEFEESARKFKSFLEEAGISLDKTDEVLTKLIEAVKSNEILSRIAAGQVFSKVSDPDRLEDFIRQQHLNKVVFLDTNVLINIICAHYEPNANYDNYHYKIAAQFLRFAQENGLVLKTIRRYAIETTRIFKNALKLIPFTDLPSFNSLGKTGNVLYNFYLHLSDWDLLEPHVHNFKDFLKEFRFEMRNPKLQYSYRSQMEYLLDSMNVEIDELEDEYNLESTNGLIDRVLREDNKFKTTYAQNSDAIMICRLGDDDVEINPIEPIFCTWDIVLMKVRKLYFNEFPNCTKWFMYTPTRIMDHFSMMNFKVRTDSLTNELLTILDDNFDFQGKTQSLIDSVKTIINPNNEIGLKYTNKLADLREEHILQVDETSDKVNESKNDGNSVDLVFHSLLTKYLYDEDNDFDSLKRLFESEELYEEVIQVINLEVKSYSQTNKLNDSFFEHMDVLIKKVQ